MSAHAVRTFDFTLGYNFEENENKIIEWLKSIANKWAFQLEKGTETGYMHWQGRINLSTKKRLSTFINESPWKGIHLSITCEENKKNFNYVTKTETRVSGPWSHEDLPTRIPRQLMTITELYPWQLQFKKLLTTFDSRSIHILHDNEGCKGKSTFRMWMLCNKLAFFIPYCNDYKDIMRMAMDGPKMGAYIFDLPRALKKEKLHQFLAGVESLKDGYVFDDRYKFQYEIIDSPGLLIITNTIPDLTLMSIDRWHIWKINEHNELLELNKYYILQEQVEEKKAKRTKKALLVQRH